MFIINLKLNYLNIKILIEIYYLFQMVVLVELKCIKNYYNMLMEQWVQLDYFKIALYIMNNSQLMMFNNL